MKKLLAVFGILPLALSSFAQTNQKFSAAALRQDLEFLRNQLFSTHADAFTEISRDQYQSIFTRIDDSIKDSLTAIEFFKLVKPTVANLSDEHAEISLPKDLQFYDSLPVFLPFTLSRSGNDYVVQNVLSVNNTLKKGDIVTQINGVPVKTLVEKCAFYTTGYPNQRADKSLSQFGYLYTLSNPFDQEFALTTSAKQMVVKGIPYSSWYNHLVSINGGNNNCDPLLSYRKIGETGYINACSFGARGDDAFKAYGKAADSLFNLAKRDNVKQVIIDVSKNSGGNSALGDFLIRQFYTGDCLTYQMNWRRSDAYLKQLKTWGIENKEYEKLKPGDVLHSGPDTPWVKGVDDLYKGKVYILVGRGTFSSAIMFATTIKDNRIATLIGEEPSDGHPTHFGELYGVKLPNTQLALRFGVKEWIRPLGKSAGNKLDPDILLSTDGGPEEIVKRLTKR